MRRILIGLATSLSIWLGSALAAEAQGITPTGPLCYTSGSQTSTYTANIYLPTPMGYKVNTQIYKNNVLQTGWSQIIPNPGVNNVTFSQVCDVYFSVQVGDVVRYEAQLLWNRTTTNATSWSVTVTGTSLPSRTGSTITKRSVPLTQKTSLRAEGVERDRRRE